MNTPPPCRSTRRLIATAVIACSIPLTLFPAIRVRAADSTAVPAASTRTAPQVTVDTSQEQAVEAFAAKVPALIANGYPKIIQILGAEKAPVPAKVHVILDMGMDGVAGTDGSGIHVAARYVAAHPNDTGMIIHELTHVAQAYPKYDPVWLVEGIADYVRWFNFEPVSSRPHPNPDKASYHDSYRTTASFLDYCVRTYDKDLVKKLDAALKSDTYSEAIFQKSTGKSLDQLNTEWLASLRATNAK